MSFIKKAGKIQACNHAGVIENNRICAYYLGGMCLCPLGNDCPYGNENKKWLLDGIEAENYSSECHKMYTAERDSWVTDGPSPRAIMNRMMREDSEE